MRLLLLACNGHGERISPKIWNYSRRSIAERWQAGYAAGTDLVRWLGETAWPRRSGLEVHRRVVPSAIPG